MQLFSERPLQEISIAARADASIHTRTITQTHVDTSTQRHKLPPNPTPHLRMLCSKRVPC